MKTINTKKGAIIVEAVLILPLVFFIVVLMIFFGNMKLIKSNVESTITEYVIKGSNIAVDPILNYCDQYGVLPTTTTKNFKTVPYRYIFDGYGDEVGSRLSKTIENKMKNNHSVFNIMSPKNIKIKGDYINHFIASSFCLDVSYKVTIPWVSIFGDSLNPEIDFQIQVPANDTAELIRNSDMVIDILKKHGVDEKISGKIADLFTKFKGLMKFVKEKE